MNMYQVVDVLLTLQGNCSRSRLSWIGSCKWRSRCTTCTQGRSCTGIDSAHNNQPHPAVLACHLILQRHQAAEFFLILTESNKIVKLGDFGVTLELNATLEMARTQVTAIAAGHDIDVQVPI